MSQHTTLAAHFAVQYVKVEAVHLESVDVPVVSIGVDTQHGKPVGLMNEVVDIQLHGRPEEVVEEFIDPLIAQLQALRADLIVEAATVPHG